MLLFVDNLTNVDFSYLDAKRGLVGETWLASIQLEGSLDEQGMICDFGIVKKIIRQWLDTHIDHCLLVPLDSPSLIEYHQNLGETHIQWKKDNLDITCSAPNQAITIADTKNIDRESVALWCIEKMSHLFPARVKSLKLSFTNEVINGPSYCYSHGLKKHDGNCQRIAHGHRSKIEIWKDGELDLGLMEKWAETFKDIYIGTKEDLHAENEDEFAFHYTSAQGKFSLTLPKENCYIIQSDSTVELIANHIAETVKASHPNNNITVKAYEGLGKGAIVQK